MSDTYVIRVPLAALDAAANGSGQGRALHVPVQVDWPELRLTDDQHLANALALMDGQPMPYPDRSIILLELPYLPPQVRR